DPWPAAGATAGQARPGSCRRRVSHLREGPSYAGQQQQQQQQQQQGRGPSSRGTGNNNRRHPELPPMSALLSNGQQQHQQQADTRTLPVPPAAAALVSPPDANGAVKSSPAAAASSAAAAAKDGGAGADASAILQALRRRWLPTLLLGLLAGALASAGAWSFIPAKFTARSLLRVGSSQPTILFAEPGGRADFLNYQRAQLAMLKSRMVLT